MNEKKYSVGELLACVVARELGNDDRVAFGLNAELMLAAAFLSQRLYAPQLRIRHGLAAGKNAELGPAAWTSDVRSRAHLAVEYTETHDAILGVAACASSQKFCDTFLVSGLQIDKHGNTNLIGIKKGGKKFWMRGPGPIGTTSIAQLAKKCFIFSLEHSRRRFVEKVDYVSSIGYDIREKYGIKNGPSLCITPLCIFDFENGIMRVKSVHPFATLRDVLDKTGFKPIIPKSVSKTKEPTIEELRVLRQIDRKGFLKRMDDEIIA